MNFRLTVAIPLAAAAVIVCGAPKVACAQEGKVIDAVVVLGVKNTPPDVVRLAATLKPGAVFRSEAFEEDKKRIRARGLYKSVAGRTEVANDKLTVVYEVEEYPVITNVVFTGNGPLAPRELYPLLRSKPGVVLNSVDLESDLNAIQRLYQERGYTAYITEEVGLDEKTSVLTIPIVVTTVEAIVIENNKKTRPFVVTREMATKVGQPLNRETLNRDLTRVYNTGLFTDLGPARSEPGSDLGRARVVIPVEERRTGQIGVIFGYSVRQRLTGTLELSESNFRGRGQGVNASWTVGGIASRNSFELGFAEPWLDKRHTSLSVSLFDRVLYRFNRVLSSNATLDQDDDPYFERRQGGSIGLSRPLGGGGVVESTTRGFVTLRTEDVKANNLQTNYNLLSNDEIESIRGSLVQNGDVSSVTLRTATNTRDNELDPATGFFLSPSVELGRSNFDYQRPRLNPAFTEGSGLERILVDRRSESGAFTKLNLDARRYFSLDGPRRAKINEPKRVLATRLLLGTAGGNIAFAEQYFLGGAETLRGYADDRFWGNRVFLGSAELRIPLDRKSGTLTGILFADVGDAWSASEPNREDIKDFEQHKSFRANVGVGFGIRVKTPIGPVRLDYGIGEVNRTHFSIGQTF